MTNDSEPFQRTEHADRPGVVGAKWWQEGLDQVDPVARRSALKGLLWGVVGLTVVGGIIGSAFASGESDGGKTESDADDFRTDTHPALEMQKTYGWNFGATAEKLVFDGRSTQAFDKSALDNLPNDLAPTVSSHYPFFVSSLLQSPTALRKTVPPGDADTFTPLKDALVPIFTPAMDVAYKRGRSLATLFDSRHPNLSTIAVIVDLPGPEAVAFAAGAASSFDPVLLFDNWPHPRGVVPSHLTLAACAYYQPLFSRAKSNMPKNAPPLFVLDRARLASYSDDAKQFDNRYVARVPSVAQLAKLGISRVLYVTPTDADLELDDLNDDFVYTVRQGAPVKLVAASSFAGMGPSADLGYDAGAGTDTGLVYFYGSDASTHEWFWNDYPWSTPFVPKGGKPPVQPGFFRSGKDYVPVPRPGPFSTGAYAGSATPPRPPTFGMVPVVVAAATGVILGARMSRSGSWTRSSSWGGG
jgi:hypothetical protein